MREFSAAIRAEAAQLRERIPARPFSMSFVGNIANNLYVRAAPLRRRGLDIEIVIHPHDDYVMSHPCWEEYDGDLVESPGSISKLRLNGFQFPSVSGVRQDAPPTQQPDYSQVRQFFSPEEYERYISFTAYLPTIAHLATRDVLLAAQCPYLALFSKRPYLTTQIGGDIWFECSRNDAYGQLQRQAFEKSNGFLVSNPWSYAHARRYGMSNHFYLPLILGQSVYSPGDAEYREIWRSQTGGSFFVLSTARLDDLYKGSGFGLRGFADFAQQCPEARLIVLGWGSDKKERLSELAKLGVADRILVLPIAGKRRLVRYLRSADCLIDQFVLGYYGATALEAMACGLPVIMRLAYEQYDALCETGAPPVLRAESADDVTRHLLTLANNPAHLSAVRASHREWFIRNHGDERWAQDYENILVAAASGHRLCFENSPLRAPLTSDELEYQGQELANAPTFPRYS